MLARIKRKLPLPLKAIFKPIYLYLLHKRPRLLMGGKGFDQYPDMIPPSGIDYVGGGNFAGIGKNFLDHFKDLADLKPDDKVLDVGCGVGRMAIPLTQYLSDKAEYHGFDVVKAGIDWCNHRIAHDHPHFQFHLADIQNRAYNPQGKVKADQYQFPFENAYFDFVYVTSVFTHMFPADMENYLSEISRVLKPNGKIFFTFFCLNEESIKLMPDSKPRFNFKYSLGSTTNSWSVSFFNPEKAVGYQEAYMLQLLDRMGFDLKGPVHYGYWCGRKGGLSHQDIVVAIRR